MALAYIAFTIKRRKARTISPAITQPARHLGLILAKFTRPLVHETLHSSMRRPTQCHIGLLIRHVACEHDAAHSRILTGHTNRLLLRADDFRSTFIAKSVQT